MKRPILIIALLCSTTFLTHGDDDTLTAVELAHHLGIKSWVSKMHLQGADYDLQVIHVRNGKVVGSVLSGTAAATDREFTRVAIQASQTQNGTKLSIETQSGPWAIREHDASISLETIVPLPTVLEPGDYVLGGDIPYERIGSGQAPLRIEDIKDGLLLRVTKRA